MGKFLDWVSVNSIFVAVCSKEWICGCSLAGIVGSNPTGDMRVCLM